MTQHCSKLPAKKRRRPRKPSPEEAEQDQIPWRDAPAADRLIQRDGERGRRGVAEPFEHRIEFPGREPKPVPQRGQEPAIGLMKDRLTEIMDANAEFFEDLQHRLSQPLDRDAKERPSLYANGMAPVTDRLQTRRLPRPAGRHLDQPMTHSVRVQANAHDPAPCSPLNLISNHESGSRPIPEQDRRPLVPKVKEL